MFVGVTSKLYYWQIIKGSSLKLEASYQYKGSQKIIASRGSIYANDSTWLVTNRSNWLLFAELPQITESLDQISTKLEKIIGEDKLSIFDKLNRKDVVWVPIKHKLTTTQKEEIINLGIKGLGFEAEETRYYPEGSQSAQLLGFVGKNNEGKDTGYFGLEGYYNLSLSGKDGYVQREKDLLGVPLLSSGINEINLVPGNDIKTFIDKRITAIADEKLKEGIEKYGAKEGSVVVMDPNTGAILAMSSYPSYDPAKFNDYDGIYYRNPIISDTFEPGSVFKVIVMAAGIDNGSIKPDTICDICDKPYKVDKYYIETWDRKYHPDSTMTEVLVHSDNVGMSFIAEKLGSDKMYDYLTKFGIGKLSEIDLQGESNIPLRKKGTWNIVDLATSSFGQGVSATPIQLIRASAVIANGGYLVKPRVVDNGNKVEKTRIISSESAKDMQDIMIQSAQYGESKWTNLKGFSVAGKTGTAQIPIEGHYDAEKTIASFIGFAPANNPKFIMLVTLKEPQSSQWASETAAPLWYAISKDLFSYFGIQPQN